MANLWNRDYTVTDIVSVIDILSEQCDAINKMTDGIIIGRISKYDGPIDSYSIAYTSVLAEAISKNIMAESFNVQDQLGEIPRQSYFTYEFFITSRDTPDYKYRVLFLQYGLGMYPVKVVLDDDIAKEIAINETEIIENPENFLDYITKILNSDKVTSVIISLLNIHKYQKQS